MEVTNVSSSPTSPTEGPDLCEIDVTNVAIHSVSLLICFCGLAGNGAVLWLLKLKMGTNCIFDLAVVVFIFLLFTVPCVLLFLVEDMSCSPLMPLLYLNILFHLSLVSYYWALFHLVPTKIAEYMDELIQLCCNCSLPQRLRWMLARVESWAFFALFTVIPTVTFLCPSDEQEQCRASLIVMFTVMLLLFAAPVLISSIIDFINAKWGSQQQQPRRFDNSTIIILLFTLLLSICNFLQQLGYIDVPSQVVFLLTCFHSSIKPFIYFLAGRCRRPCSMESLRLSLQRVFEEQKKKNCPKM